MNQNFNNLYMKRIALFLLFIMLACPVFAQVNLFPMPAKFSKGRGVFNVNEKTVFEGVGEYADKLASGLINEVKALNISEGDISDNHIRLALKKSPDMKKDGYTLVVSSEEVYLESSTESGLFYAKEALLQLVRFYKGKVPVLRIEDSPRFEWRGFMLDESRHFFGKEKVKQYLDIMASLKMNVFHWHLTDEPGLAY